MADAPGTELSDDKEKEADTERKNKQHTRPWQDGNKSGKVVISSTLPETLGFYDISAEIRREPRDHSAGKRRTPPLLYFLF